MELIELAQAWLAEDPDPSTRAELQALIDQRDLAALEERFQGPLEFGTAGLRGLLGAGLHRMNRVTVIRATAGLCAWVKAQVPNARDRGICVGFDGRRMSREFADDVATVIAGAGLRAHVFSRPVPTPVLGFCVLKTGAAAGVTITASHNPPDYNGYKVFWENGAQIIPPHDQGIADAIAATGRLAEIPRLGHDDATAADLYRSLDELENAYVARVAQLVPLRSERGLRVAYTAMHGVGERFIRATFERTQLAELHTVAEQAEPDGGFPTVAFPNPEEPGAMDLVLALGERTQAHLVLANDPDADRLAVSVRNDDGGYEGLSGNDIGCILAYDALRKRAENDRSLVVSTIVSSPLLAAIAQHFGARYEQTLTGHKWIQNRALELEAEGFEYVFGYEEALGYAATPFVRDKDGISAAVLMTDLAVRCLQQGETILDLRERIWRECGLFLSSQLSVVFDGGDGKADMDAVMMRYRNTPPNELGGHRVIGVTDVLKGERRNEAGQTSAISLPASNLLVFDLADGHRAMLRPSGTEPKLKYYIDARIDVRATQPITEARAEAEAVLTAIAASFRARGG